MVKRTMKVMMAVTAALLLSLPQVNAQGAPGVTITAPESITLPPSGYMPVPVYPLQLESVNNYAGSVAVACNWLNPNAEVATPACVVGNGLPQAIQIAAGETYTSEIKFQQFVPVTGDTSMPLKGGALALAALLLLGLPLGWRSRKIGLPVLCVAAGIAAIGLNGCSGGNGSQAKYTPGSYTYALVVTDVNTSKQLATAQFTLVIPKGE